METNNGKRWGRLLPQEFVPPGFETVIGHPDHEMGRTWNLWFNLTLSDEPGKWDVEIRHLNRMQGELEALTDDQRLIRAQMAEFCRYHPSFPLSIDILCEEIGTGRFSKPVRMGCEGRNLLESLGHHSEEEREKEKSLHLENYLDALRSWLNGKAPEKPIEFRAAGYLGSPTGSKTEFVRELIASNSLKETCWSKAKETLGHLDSINYRPFYCFKCGGCDCDKPRFLDVGILCASRADEETMVTEMLRYTQEYVLAYALAINSWLAAERPKIITGLIEPHYLDEAFANKMGKTIHSLLGEKDPAKKWLAACLLKTLAGNQRWHGRKELLDDFSEAVSYFKSSS